ncbi:hypothetical protein [Mesorhizobium marinum]|uniref:hypothetical protein n=1 Tax=Mesorhizobium marinum TaxID=3228790 RepID=UPI0034656E7E
MDVASVWRTLRTNPAEVPQPGVLVQSAGFEITINAVQECVVALPPRATMTPVVDVIVISQHPGIAGTVSIGANFNSPDGSYQGPTTIVGQGQFTETISEVRARFVLLPSGFPVVGIGAVADYADGVHSVTLTYQQIACNPWVWWRWLSPVAGTLSQFL